MTGPSRGPSRLRLLLVTAALGAPAVAGLGVAGAIGLAAFAIGGFGPGGPSAGDPLVALAPGGGTGPAGMREYRRAMRLSPLDHRYPYRAALLRLFPGGGSGSGADRVEALTLLGRSAGLAPSDAVVRLLLSETSASLGREEDAAREALAAAELAPMNMSVKRRAARFFEDRYARRGVRDDLSRAIDAREGDLVAMRDLLREGSELSYEGMVAAVDAADVDREWVVLALVSAGRADWAVRFGEQGGVSGAVAAQARTARGETRLAAGDAAGAVEDLAEAQRLLGEGFRGHGALGEARLTAGGEAEGFAALSAALRGGESAASVAARIARAGAAEKAAEFWGREARSGDRAVALEYADALAQAGRPAEAAVVLRPLLDAPGVAGRANLRMARILLDAGQTGMARRYARAALAAEPGLDEAAGLLERIGE